MAVLYDLLFVHAAPVPDDGIFVTFVQEDEDIVQQPSHPFVVRLLQRRLPHETRIKQYGVAGQNEGIRAGIDQLLRSQAENGSFGDLGATGYGTLALLAEGDSSVQSTKRGRAIRDAVNHLLARVELGDVHGAALSALVEDYALSYESLRDEERVRYAHAIRSLILAARSDAAWQEGLALASLAGFPLPAGRTLGDALYLARGTNPAPLLGRTATRLRATVLLARGHLVAERVRVRRWARALFVEALETVEAGKATGLVLLTLQAPYRL